MSKRRRPSTRDDLPPAPPQKDRWFVACLVGVALGAIAGWCAHRAPAAPPPPSSSAPLPSDLTASQRTEVDEFVKRYFGSWSKHDLDTYERCFHPNARIWFGTGTSLGLAPFIESQRQAQSLPIPLTEDPLAWDGNVNNGLAHVRVHWELHRGAERIRGYDFFTLAHADGRWQIVALVFNEE